MSNSCASRRRLDLRHNGRGRRAAARRLQAARLATRRARIVRTATCDSAVLNLEAEAAEAAATWFEIFMNSAPHRGVFMRISEGVIILLGDNPAVRYGINTASAAMKMALHPDRTFALLPA